MHLGMENCLGDAPGDALKAPLPPLEEPLPLPRGPLALCRPSLLPLVLLGGVCGPEAPCPVRKFPLPRLQGVFGLAPPSLMKIARRLLLKVDATVRQTMLIDNITNQ
jgi:hypothetical protein